MIPPAKSQILAFFKQVVSELKSLHIAHKNMKSAWTFECRIIRALNIIVIATLKFLCLKSTSTYIITTLETPFPEAKIPLIFTPRCFFFTVQH